MDDQYELEDEANQGAPSVLLPADLTALDPAWKSCVLGGLDLGRDPPRALQPASNMAPKATSHGPAPIETQSVAFPHSTPKSPGPHPTQSSQSTKTELPSNSEDSTKVAVEYVQEPSSVCLPIPRPQGSMPAALSSSRSAAAQVKPRSVLELAPAETTPLPSSVEAYISATSYAALESVVLAFESEISSDASVGGLPPVAPSNPYLALPKHRSAKRSYTSSPMTQSLNSTTRSTDPVNSALAAETSLVIPSATSAADVAADVTLPASSVTEFPTTFAPVPTASRAPSDPEDADNGVSPYETCGQGNLEAVVITTRDVPLLSSTLSKSASLASWVATGSPEERSLSVEHSAQESDPSGSSRPVEELQSSGRIRQILSNTVTVERSKSGSITPASGTTSISDTTASTHTATGSRIHIAESEGLWIAFLGSIVCSSLI